jgi:predicted DNA-binding transcriptional regulator AlpA
MLTDFRILATRPATPRVMVGLDPTTPAKVATPLTYTLRDLEQVFGRREMDVLWRKWRKDSGFPQPLPWSRKPLRWNAEAVLRWKAAREAEAGSV